jgi:MoaA/NifB/PqqE/SkfB family radical SAM enzyme/Tfp pilus assembly protein PilF
MDGVFEAGKKFVAEQQYDKAVASFEQVLRLNPSDQNARFELGKVYYLQGAMDRALDEFTRTIDLDASHACARMLLGKTYKARGEFDKALEQFRQALQLGYRGENVAKEMADLYRLRGNYPAACSFLGKARDDGYSPENYKKEIADICREQIRQVQQYNFDGRDADVLGGYDSVMATYPEISPMMRNSVLNEKEIVERKTVLESKMKSLTFTLTNRCNLACVMCETRKIPWDLPERVKREIVTLLPFIERVMWQGGEAFLYDGFEELLDEAAKYPIRQVLATNGMLINERIAEKLVRYNVELTFSIDGMTKEVYEHIRPGARFEKVLENVRLINELRKRNNPGMRTRLNVLVMRANYLQIEQFVEFAHQYNFSTLFFNSTGCDFKNLNENVFYYNRDADIIGHIDTIRDRVAAKAQEYGISLENWLPSKKFFGDITGQNRPEPAPAPGKPAAAREDRLFCHAPWQRLYIDCGGRVRPDCLCPFERDIGNLKESSLMELWNGEKMQEFRKKIIAGNLEGFCNNDCVHCRVPKKNLKFI